jgi:L-threonate 2-dehydrogenase
MDNFQGGEGEEMTSNQSQVIGFVGLGAMGRGMASTLAKAGFRVKGYDINPASVRTFAAAGGEGVTSVAETAEGADALVIMVVNAEQAEEVLFGAGAAAQALPLGSVVILSSTVKPEFARKTASRLYALGQEDDTAVVKVFEQLASITVSRK